MSDDDIWALSRGGHDAQKVYAAYHAAVNHTDQPTVILAKTVKGYGMGEAGEGQNITHQQKKMGESVLRNFRDRFHIDVTVPHDQASRLSLAMPRFFRMWSTAAPTSFTASAVVPNGGFAPGGWSIAAGRVEPP